MGEKTLQSPPIIIIITLHTLYTFEKKETPCDSGEFIIENLKYELNIHYKILCYEKSDPDGLTDSSSPEWSWTEHGAVSGSVTAKG